MRRSNPASLPLVTCVRKLVLVTVHTGFSTAQNLAGRGRKPVEGLQKFVLLAAPFGGSFVAINSGTRHGADPLRSQATDRVGSVAS